MAPRPGRLAAIVLLMAALPAAAATIDVPLPGRSLAFTADGARRSLAFRTERAPGVEAPLPDPAAGARLVIFASHAAGQCHVDVALPAAGWRPVAQPGAARGWRYRDPAGTVAGVRGVTVTPGRDGAGGRVVVKVRGDAFPCTLALAQALPVQVAVTLGTKRWCAAFDAPSVRANAPGRFRAAHAPAPAACPDGDVTLANLNILHGLFCPPGTGNCRLTDRVALLGQWVVARGCPDVVTLEEVAPVLPALVPALEAALLTACPTPYHAVLLTKTGVDEQMMLSRHRVLASERRDLVGPLRTVTRIRIDHPLGPVDVYATHLASGADGAGNACATAAPCPAECVAAGAATIRDCQAVQTAAFVAATRNAGMPALLAGDFNAPPGSVEQQRFTAPGWIDAYAAAGNPPCDPGTGLGCTSGRDDVTLTELESPALNQAERIDAIFVVPPAAPSACTPALDGPGDDDGDGVATRHFADLPNPFAPACGPAPLPVCWPSDHGGVQADVNCG